MEPRNRCQGIISASLCSLAGRYDNPIPPWFLAPIDFLKIPALSLRQNGRQAPLLFNENMKKRLQKEFGKQNFRLIWVLFLVHLRNKRNIFPRSWGMSRIYIHYSLFVPIFLNLYYVSWKALFCFFYFLIFFAFYKVWSISDLCTGCGR